MILCRSTTPRNFEVDLILISLKKGGIQHMQLKNNTAYNFIQKDKLPVKSVCIIQKLDHYIF